MTVIFDLDGTLVNSLFDLGDSVNAALEESGLPQRSYDEYRAFVGNGTGLLVNRAVPDDVKGTLTEQTVFERFSELYRQNCLCKTKPYDGIPEVLTRLRLCGFSLAVASNKPVDFCRHIVKVLFGDGIFDVVEGARGGVAKKPQPDIIYSIITQLCEKKSDCVIVGDSDVDVLTAKNAGLRVIGCSWGFRSKESLELVGCDKIIDLPDELEKAVIDLFERNGMYGLQH